MCAWEVMARMPTGDVETFHADGQWHNRIEGEVGIQSSFDYKKEAVKRGQRRPKEGQAEHTIRDRDGTVTEHMPSLYGHGASFRPCWVWPLLRARRVFPSGKTRSCPLGASTTGTRLPEHPTMPPVVPMTAHLRGVLAWSIAGPSGR